MAIEDQNYSDRDLPKATPSTTNPTWTVLVSKPGPPRAEGGD
jgi:hypothetical protein